MNRSGSRGSRRSEAVERRPPVAERHPLPWRNRPAGADHHVIDARGDVVYEGSDPAEMFRLLAAATARAGPQRRYPPAPSEREPVTGSRTP
jgi:hypothetical protein